MIKLSKFIAFVRNLFDGKPTNAGQGEGYAVSDSRLHDGNISDVSISEQKYELVHSLRSINSADLEGDSSAEDADSFAQTTYTECTTPPQAIHQLRSDGSEWGTPIELLNVSDGVTAILNDLGIETVEEALEREDELLESSLSDPEVLFELRMSLADWLSHTKEMANVIFDQEATNEDFSLLRRCVELDPGLDISGLAVSPVEYHLGSEHVRGLSELTEQSECAKSQCYSCEIALEALEEVLAWRTSELSISRVDKKILSACEDSCQDFHRPVVQDREEHIRALLTQIDSRWTVKDRILWPPIEARASFDEDPKRPLMSKLPQQTERNKEIEVKCCPVRDEKMSQIGPDYSVTNSPDTLAAITHEIHSMLAKSYLPLSKQEIVARLEQKYPLYDVVNAIKNQSMFQEVYKDHYIISGRSSGIQSEELINGLPETLKRMMNYLLAYRNNCSYKMVLASIFFAQMDEDGSVPLSTLRSEMYAYYKNRKDCGGIVEAQGSIAAKIDEFKQIEFERSVLKNPLQSFLSSGYFFLEEGKLRLLSELRLEISFGDLKLRVLTILAEALAKYFQTLTGQQPDYLTKSEEPMLARENQNGIDPGNEHSKDGGVNRKLAGLGADFASVSIKRKQKTKIQI